MAETIDRVARERIDAHEKFCTAVREQNSKEHAEVKESLFHVFAALETFRKNSFMFMVSMLTGLFTVLAAIIVSMVTLYGEL